MVTIASWNVNSIRARLDGVTAWLASAQPDVACLQELKCTEDQFPRLAIEALGYRCALLGQPTYNGVALLSRLPIDDVTTGLPGDEADTQARWIEATIAGVRVCCLYLPNGNGGEEKFTYKLGWMDRLAARAASLLSDETPSVLAGDFNVIPEAEDCWDPASWAGDALFRPESRSRFHALLHAGWTDAFRAVNRDGHQYTFWDYQAGRWQRDQGIRIDHLLLSPQIADRLSDCRIDRGPRGLEKASDHTPILVTIAD